VPLLALDAVSARITALAALLAVTVAGGFLAYQVLTREHAQDTADVFAQRWSSGNDASAARVTDDPQAAAAALNANRAGLDGAKLKATLGEVKESGDSATATLSLRWQVPRIGRWRYDSKLRLRRSGDEWQVRWSPTLVHPRLDAGTRLGTTSMAKARGQILDRDRRPLMHEQRVVRVGAVAGKVKRPAVTARGLAEVLGVDPAPLERAIREGGKEQFVDAIVMRPGDYRPLRVQVEAVPDAETAEGTAMLAPSRESARALLGAVAPATKEQLEKLGGRVAPGASVGQWGLQARFEPRLAPVPERRVVIREEGVPVETLLTHGGRRGRAVATTLDRRVQAAAEEALSGTTDEAALVAVQPSTGDVLAVANRPVESTYNRAFEGTYAPGSTFKVVSTAAMALVAATVADGRWRAPRLLAVDPQKAGPALAGSERDTLRSLMRLVVTEGSGTALAGVPGEVRGKSGTAEFGGGDPPPTHAWFIAYRDDVAIAVLVERGRSGGSVAAPLAARFFNAL
jgi:cell division protein FtsI/penicillin-binding protein 2